MNSKKINLKKYEAYEKVINIKLFNDIVSFIMETTSIDCNDFVNKLKLKNIWFERTMIKNIQEEYKFKYFGELLERYEQRIGTDIKDIRAIALSLGYSRELITNDMIIGTQVVDFINKIKRLSENDIYLKAALYLYDENRYYHLFEELVNQTFKTTEDALFVLSLFYDRKHGFDLLEPQLINLLGKSKTIFVMENYGIYNWLINIFYPILSKDRRKGIELFKAIISIPTGLIKEDIKEYKTLVNNGYTKEEISFLNYISIFYVSIPKKVRIGKSIVEEKIAVNFCINILNSKMEFSDEIYELIFIMLDDYYRFDIKCYGFEGIKEAIINSINITVPKAFIKFYEKLGRKLFSFDILDNKWNIVKELIEPEEYRGLFDNYLLLGNFNKEQMEQRIKKYDELTNLSYIDSFNIHKYSRGNIYAKLVEMDLINLVNQFENYLNNKNNSESNSTKSNIDLQHLREYTEEIRNKKAFDFYKYCFDSNKFSIMDIDKFNFKIGSLYEKRGYYYSSRPDIDIKRNFLTKEENIELLYWLEKYIFYIRPNYYMDFVIAMLKDEFIQKLLPKEDLRNLYFTVIEIDNNIKENRTLREIYLSKEELEVIIKEEKEAQLQLERLEQMQRENEVLEKFKSIENITFKEIYEFCYNYRWQREETKIACRIIKEYLNNFIEQHIFVDNEIIYFNKICNLLIEQKYITTEELKNYIVRFVKKGELVPCKQY